MQPQNKFAKLAILATVGSLLLSISTLAAAESDTLRALYVSAANVPTNIPGVRTYAEPPKGFNPVTATDVELATYGFPSRPDKQAEPDHYAVWERAMKRAKIHWNGELKRLPGSGHGKIPTASMVLPDAVQSQATKPQPFSNLNASGVMLQNNQTSWSEKNSFNQIGATMTVPVAQAPFGASCSSYGPWAELSLVSIDGFIYLGSADGYPLFKPGVGSGVLSDGSCASNGPYQPYVVYGDLRVGGPDIGFKVNPGDIVFAYAEAPNSTEAYFYIEDETLQMYTSAGIGLSVSVVGQNAEWTVSRLVCPGPPFSGCSPSTGPDGETPLANTTDIFFDDGYAENPETTKLFYPGSQASSTLVMTMMDDDFNQYIETVNQGSSGYEGLHALEFSTDQCAVEGGCTP